MPLGSSAAHIVEAHFLLESAPIRSGQLVVLMVHLDRFRPFRFRDYWASLADGSTYLIPPGPFLREHAKLYPSLQRLATPLLDLSTTLRVSRARVLARVTGGIGAWAATRIYGADRDVYYSPTPARLYHPIYRQAFWQPLGGVMIARNLAVSRARPEVRQAAMTRGAAVLDDLVWSLQRRGAKVALFESPNHPEIVALRSGWQEQYLAMIQDVCSRRAIPYVDLNPEVRLIREVDFVDGWSPPR